MDVGRRGRSGRRGRGGRRGREGRRARDVADIEDVGDVEDVDVGDVGDVGETCCECCKSCNRHHSYVIANCHVRVCDMLVLAHGTILCGIWLINVNGNGCLGNIMEKGMSRMVPHHWRCCPFDKQIRVAERMARVMSSKVCSPSTSSS